MELEKAEYPWRRGGNKRSTEEHMDAEQIHISVRNLLLASCYELIRESHLRCSELDFSVSIFKDLKKKTRKILNKLTLENLDTLVNLTKFLDEQNYA